MINEGKNIKALPVMDIQKGYRKKYGEGLLTRINQRMTVINRFLVFGMTMEEVSVKMDASVKDLTKLLNE